MKIRIFLMASSVVVAESVRTRADKISRSLGDHRQDGNVAVYLVDRIGNLAR